MLPWLCHASSQGDVQRAATASPRASGGTRSARKPAHPAQAVSTSVSQGQSMNGTKLRAMPVAHATVTSSVSG